MSRIIKMAQRTIDIDNPQIDDISIEDIARGLSKQCCYNGQIDEYYSYAERALWKSYLVPSEFAKEALLADFDIAYFGWSTTDYLLLLVKDDEYFKLSSYFEAKAKIKNPICDIVKKKFGLRFHDEKFITSFLEINLERMEHEILLSQNFNGSNPTNISWSKAKYIIQNIQKLIHKASFYIDRREVTYEPFGLDYWFAYTCFIQRFNELDNSK